MTRALAAADDWTAAHPAQGFGAAVEAAYQKAYACFGGDVSRDRIDIILRAALPFLAPQPTRGVVDAGTRERMIRDGIRRITERLEERYGDDATEKEVLPGMVADAEDVVDAVLALLPPTSDWSARAITQDMITTLRAGLEDRAGIVLTNVDDGNLRMVLREALDTAPIVRTSHLSWADGQVLMKRNNELLAEVERLRAAPAPIADPRVAALLEAARTALYRLGILDEADKLRAALAAFDAPAAQAESKPFDPATSPSMTDMMVPPETLDGYMAANPLPDPLATALKDTAKACEAATAATLVDTVRAQAALYRAQLAAHQRVAGVAQAMLDGEGKGLPLHLRLRDLLLAIVGEPGA